MDLNKDKNKNKDIEYVVNNEYAFYNSFDLIENINKELDLKTNNNPINLGKFIKYLTILYWGDMLDRGKAVFENGIVNSNDFKYIKKLIN